MYPSPFLFAECIAQALFKSQFGIGDIASLTSDGFAPFGGAPFQKVVKATIVLVVPVILAIQPAQVIGGATPNVIDNSLNLIGICDRICDRIYLP